MSLSRGSGLISLKLKKGNRRLKKNNSEHWLLKWHWILKWFQVWVYSFKRKKDEANFHIFFRFLREPVGVNAKKTLKAGVVCQKWDLLINLMNVQKMPIVPHTRTEHFWKKVNLQYVGWQIILLPDATTLPFEMKYVNKYLHFWWEPFL